LAKEAESDILLRTHSKELRRAALLYVFEVQARLFKEGNRGLTSNLTQMGLIVSEGARKTLISIEGNQFDVKGKIHQKTVELMKRTEDLNKNFTA
jgi:hypothetical protein